MTQITCKRCGKRLIFESRATGDGFGVGLYTRWLGFDDEEEGCVDQFGKLDTHRPDRTSEAQAINDFIEWLSRQIREQGEVPEWNDPL